MQATAHLADQAVVGLSVRVVAGNMLHENGFVKLCEDMLLLLTTYQR